LKMHHVAVLNHEETIGLEIIDSIQSLDYQLKNKQNPSYPILHKVNKHITLTVNEDDVGYINYLAKTLDLAKCLHSKVVKHVEIPNQFKRFVFFNNADFMPPNFQAFKSIHYSKNVLALGVHQSLAPSNTIVIEGNYTDDEFVSHFREIFKEPFISMTNQTTSIRNVNISLKFLAFLVQNVTNKCYTDKYI
jgi:hypothetical protein